MTTAANMYAHNAASVAERLADIQALLAKHAERQAADARNWGYAGDLSHVDNLLAQVVHALGGTPIEG